MKQGAFWVPTNIRCHLKSLSCYGDLAPRFLQPCCTRTYTHILTYIHTHTHIYTQTATHIQTHTHARTQLNTQRWCGHRVIEVCVAVWKYKNRWVVKNYFGGNVTSTCSARQNIAVPLQTERYTSEVIFFKNRKCARQNLESYFDYIPNYFENAYFSVQI